MLISVCHDLPSENYEQRELENNKDDSSQLYRAFAGHGDAQRRATMPIMADRPQ